MKKIWVGLMFAGLFFTACSGGRGRVTVSIEGLADDSLICSYFTPATIREREEVTTLFVGGEKHGEKTEFSIDLPEDGHLYRIFLAPQSFRGDGPKQGMELYLGPGERIAVRATYDPKSRVIEYTLAGSEAQQRWRDDEQKLEPLRLQLEMLGRTARMISPYRRNDSDTVMREMQRLSDSIQRHKEAYIAAHPADPASAYHLISLPNAERFDSLYRTLDPAVQQGVLREWMDLQLEFLAKQSATEQAREAVVEGGSAPDFTLPNRTGGDFTLSSLYGTGKYIVLDFWGTWCGWCMKGMPAMKQAYEKHRGAVEFVGIDCGDKEEVWRATVEKQQLPWINVRAADDEILVRFGIEGFPTKMILDPSGKIVARYTGEDPAFYTTLDSLVGRSRRAVPARRDSSTRARLLE